MPMKEDPVGVTSDTQAAAQTAGELPAPPRPEPPPPSHRDDHSPSAPFEEPRGTLEALLVKLWSEALMVTPLGIHDDFFEMGGHSLMAAQLVVDIQEAVGCEVPARTLFLQPTIAELAAVISGDAVTEADE